MQKSLYNIKLVRTQIKLGKLGSFFQTSNWKAEQTSRLPSVQQEYGFKIIFLLPRLDGGPSGYCEAYAYSLRSLITPAGTFTNLLNSSLGSQYTLQYPSAITVSSF